MLIRDREYKTCGKCGDRKMTHDQIHGCDQCRTVIDFNKKDVQYFDATLFWFGSGDRTTRPIFCSMRCFVDWFVRQPLGADLDFMSFPLWHAADLRKLQNFLVAGGTPKGGRGSSPVRKSGKRRA